MTTPIEKKYIASRSKSEEKFKSAQDLFPNGVTHDARMMSPFPYYISHSEGSKKWDIDGNEYVDYKSGHGSMLLGHAHPEIVKVVSETVAKGSLPGASTELEVAWGKAIQDLVPSAERIRFTSSGTEADMMGMRIMRAYTGKNKIVKFEHHFHGWSDCASATGGTDDNWEYGVPQQILDTMIIIPPNDISILENLLNKDDDIAGVMLEPTGAHMGLHPIRQSFLKELRQLCTDRGLVLMFDEVVTGFRVAKGGAEEYMGVTPDISSWAKILGGGMPGGCVTGKAEFMEIIEKGSGSKGIYHPGTFNANPISAAAGATALTIVKNSNVNEIAAKRGQELVDGLNGVLSKLEIPGLAYGQDSLVHFKLGVDADSVEDIITMTKEEEAKAFDGSVHHQLGLSLLNQGVDTWSAARFIMMASHTEDDVNKTVSAMENAFIEAREQGSI
jgi:glutamate-1-semialdehyde 2,1-aminomutase